MNTVQKQQLNLTALLTSAVRKEWPLTSQYLSSILSKSSKLNLDQGAEVGY